MQDRFDPAVLRAAMMSGVATALRETQVEAPKATLDEAKVIEWCMYGDVSLMERCTPYLEHNRVTEGARRLLWQHVVPGTRAESLLLDYQLQQAATGDHTWSDVAARAHSRSWLESFSLLLHHMRFQEERFFLARCKKLLWSVVRFVNTPVSDLACKRS